MATTEPKRKPGRPRNDAATHDAPVADTAPQTATGLPDFELTGLSAEAFEAYDMQDQRVRFDSLGRKWTFQLGSSNDHGELELILQQGDATHEDRISTALLASDLGRDLIADTVRALDEAP